MIAALEMTVAANLTFCNTSKLPQPCNLDLLQGIAYSPVFLVGLIVNAAALRVFIAKRDAWTETHIYMLNMAIADFTLITFLPFRIYDAFDCLKKSYLCTFLINTHFINMYASVLTITAISVHRYLSIRFPLRVRSQRRKKLTAFVVCLSFWVLLLTLCAIFYDDNRPDKLWTCYERCKNIRLQTGLITLLLLLGFFAPLLIIVFCSSQIICILLKTDVDSEEKKSTIGMVTANMIVFITCYLPINVAFLVNYFSNIPENWMLTPPLQHKFLLVAEWIATTNCCFDSISYYFLLRDFYS